jgi:hypothetical protein
MRLLTAMKCRFERKKPNAVSSHLGCVTRLWSKWTYLGKQRSGFGNEKQSRTFFIFPPFTPVPKYSGIPLRTVELSGFNALRSGLTWICDRAEDEHEHQSL